MTESEINKEAKSSKYLESNASEGNDATSYERGVVEQSEVESDLLFTNNEDNDLSTLDTVRHQEVTEELDIARLSQVFDTSSEKNRNLMCSDHDLI